MPFLCHQILSRPFLHPTSPPTIPSLHHHTLDSYLPDCGSQCSLRRISKGATAPATRPWSTRRTESRRHITQHKTTDEGAETRRHIPHFTIPDGRALVLPFSFLFPLHSVRIRPSLRPGTSEVGGRGGAGGTSYSRRRPPTTPGSVVRPPRCRLCVTLPTNVRGRPRKHQGAGDAHGSAHAVDKAQAGHVGRGSYHWSIDAYRHGAMLLSLLSGKPRRFPARGAQNDLPPSHAVEPRWQHL